MRRRVRKRRIQGDFNEGLRRFNKLFHSRQCCCYKHNFIHNNSDMLLIIDTRLKLVLCFSLRSTPPPRKVPMRGKSNHESENPLLSMSFISSTDCLLWKLNEVWTYKRIMTGTNNVDTKAAGGGKRRNFFNSMGKKHKLLYANPQWWAFSGLISKLFHSQ